LTAGRNVLGTKGPGGCGSESKSQREEIRGRAKGAGRKETRSGGAKKKKGDQYVIMGRG